MSTVQERLPTVVIPYETECRTEMCQDVCVYLRPEANGIQVESVMMRTIQTSDFYRERVKLVYLANLPGGFIGRRRIIEKHYHLKIKFATRGRGLFTDFMKRRFSEYFGVPFEKAEIWGSFEVMKRKDYTRTGLFDIWVPQEKMLFLNGQTIKQVGDVFIINYDIPAILMKNHIDTDMAVMILRTDLNPKEVHGLMMRMVDSLKSQGLVTRGESFTRVFHYSRSPFEQILDGIGFLYDPDGGHVPLKGINFYAYLLSRGLTDGEIKKIIQYPIFNFRGDDGEYYEKTIYTASYGMGYDDAYQTLVSARGQVLLA